MDKPVRFADDNVTNRSLNSAGPVDDTVIH